MQEFHFPSWVNKFTVIVIVSGVLVAGYLATCLFAGVHPRIINVGYQPNQPVPFSHKIHAGALKLDCRYCHNTVERAGQAAIPPTSTCGNCHGGNRIKVDEKGLPVTLGIVQPDSVLLEPIRESLETNLPMEWIRVHDLPDFVYFNHAVHVNRGVSCISCHGRVDQMEIVTKVESHSMKWCLDCHRNPEKNIRNPELVTQLDFVPTDAEGNEIDPLVYGKEWAKRLQINPNISCSTCHR